MLRTVFLILVGLQTARAAFERGPGAIPGFGGAGAGIPATPWACFTNPAALASADVRTLALSHIPLPFGLSELARSTAVLVQPLPFASFALSAERHGFELYRELSFGLSAGTRLAPGWDGGLTVRSHTLSIAGYGSATTIGVDAGILVALTDDAFAGCTAMNINAPAIGRARERLPQILALGVSYSPLGDVRMAVDLVKDIRYPLEVHAGIEYFPVAPVCLRAGSGTEPSSFHAGIAVAYHPLEFQYGYSGHADLGATHQFSLLFALDMF